MIRSQSLAWRFDPDAGGRRLLTRPQCWLLALATPGILGPTWCYFTGWLPAQLGTLTGLVLVLLLGVSTITDASRRKIFNWATYSAFGWALAINAVAERGDHGVIGLPDCLIGAAVCGGFVLLAYSLARSGAGDVKLATTIGALLGVEQGSLAVCASYIFAGGAILLWSIWATGLCNFLRASAQRLGASLFPERMALPSLENQAFLNKPIPLAPYFFCGTLTVVIWF